MIILGIETSCDETALSIIEAEGSVDSPIFKVLSSIVLSQAKLHEQYGGVFPNLARREHGINLIPLLKKVLEDAQMLKFKTINPKADSLQSKAILEKEPELLKQFLELIPILKKPQIDLIAVTQGPGLEPALWVGISFAKALSDFWSIPLMPVNHMEGHIASILPIQHTNNLLQAKSQKLKAISFPTLALLVSGGHTELVLIKKWGEYTKIAITRDDAIGEAFDKVARILGLPYPGGPEISRMAEEARSLKLKDKSFSLPRPMINSPELDFSFSGLKTAVLYMVKKIPNLTNDIKQQIALEFEEAVTDVLLSKTKKALIKTGAKNLIIAGGVSANVHIKQMFAQFCADNTITLHTPPPSLTGDNALMIACAGYIQYKLKKEIVLELKASGNLSL